MHRLSATDAKNTFAQLLAFAQQGGVEIEKHGKVVAVVLPPGAAAQAPDARRAALAQQASVELARLMRHQRAALNLLSLPAAQARKRVKQAQRIVDQWEADGVCSQDFIRAWRQLLALPVKSLALEMCGDLKGWGPALRQNSPWSLIP